MKTITSSAEFTDFVYKNEVALIYFSTPTCNVCKVLKPKIINLVNSDYPKIKMGFVDSSELKELTAQNSIFTAPTVLVFIDGKEFLRKSRNISITEFSNNISRLYTMFFK